MYKLLIVDDEPLVQAGIKSMLNWAEMNIEICGTAMNGQVALKIIEEVSPDIVITDIKMPVMNGLELAKVCYERYGSRHPVFIILTSYEDFHMAKEALTYQVANYLVKIELTPESLKDAVVQVMKQIEAEDARQRESKQDAVHPFYDKFFIRLLHNLFESDEQFLLQSKDLNLDFHYNSYVCCYGELTSASADALPVKGQLSLFNSSFQILQELLAKYMPCYSVSLDIRHFALIFCYEDAPGSNDYDRDIKVILENISTTLFHYYKVSLRCGIGSSVNTPYAVCDSYQYSRQAFHAANEQHSITFYEEEIRDGAFQRSFNFSLFKDNLTRAFEEYDPDILEQTIDEICDLFISHPNHYVQSLDAACNILYLSLSLLQNGEEIISDIFKENPEGYRSIYKQSSVEQVINWLTYFNEQLCIIFRERRKDYKNHIVMSVKKYIGQNVKERLSLNEVAAVFGISPNYLSQLFKKYNDAGFNEYVTSCKINEAKKLLEESNLKVYEIAETLGFESAFYFSKVFKKVEGCSPTEYINSKMI